MDIKIIVATHKKYWMPKENIYLPLHVGKKGKESLGYIGDDTGENISDKNANYCELTGLYWGWKNLECDYIGLCHYRRYFGRKPQNSSLEAKEAAIFKREDYEELLTGYDIILPKKRNYYIETVRSQYEHAHNREDLLKTEKIIAEMYPKYSETFTKVMNKRTLYILNMFVLKKEDFNDYCTWLFNILAELEKEIDTRNYNSYEKRVFGFIGERLLNVWIEKRQLKVIEAEVINLEKINWPRKITSFLYRKIRG